MHLKKEQGVFMSILKSNFKQSRTKIYEGGCKDVFQIHDDETTLVLFFKDQLRYLGENFIISGKGVINNTISAFLLEKLDLIGINNHLIDKANMREQVVQILDMIPVQIKISNVAVDDYVTKYGVQEGFLFETPMIQYSVKTRKSSYPLINESQISGFHWAFEDELELIKKVVYRTNDYLSGYFSALNLRLIECNLEFGRVFNGEEFVLMLADEITIESCRLWDLSSNQKFDVETIINSDNPISIYKEIAKRMGIKT
jgi:phosphoribosylaminoimidazole-succinocarboxamide synthase